MNAAASTPPVSLFRLALYFLKLGSIGFGGPVALVGYMYRDLVEQRRWIADEDYKEGLTLAQLMPGPLAAQLAMYLGYVHYRIPGATVAGAAFVLPSFLMVVAIGWAYVRYGGLPWMQAAFYGVGAAVIGIIAVSACKLTARNIGRDRLLWAIYLTTAAVTVWTESESVLLFLGAGVLVWLMRAPPKRWLGRSAAPAVTVLAPHWPSACGLAGGLDWTLLGQLGAFFAKAGAFVFGSGLAIVPFLYGGVVHDHQWLNERQFVDAVAVAMITPGPVVITVGFIGYLIAGLPGAAVAALGTFLPCYLFTILPAPYFKRYGKRPALVAFIDGVTAAAIGAITGAVVVLAERSIPDWITALIALATAGLIWKAKKLPEPAIVAIAAVIGVAMPHAAHAGQREPLALVRTIPLPDVKGRIDHLDIDLQGSRLFVAALGNDTVEVVDLRAGRRSARIGHLAEPQGVAYAADSGRLFVASGRGGRVDAFAGDMAAPVASAVALEDADNLRYDAASGRLYVGYGSALAALDASTLRKLGEVELPGHPESFQLERAGSRIFVNVPAARRIAVVDRGKAAIAAAWSVGEPSANFPMALDEGEHRIFVAARRPATLLVFDTDTGKHVASLPVCGDADDLFFDGARRRIYAVCGEGAVHVVQREGADRYRPAGRVPTAPGARTGLYVSARDLLYVAVPARGASPAEIRVYRAQ